MPEVERTSGGGGRPLLTHPPCTFISLGSSPSRIRNQPPERSCYTEIKSQPSTSRLDRGGRERREEERKRKAEGPKKQKERTTGKREEEKKPKRRKKREG